MNRIDVLLPPGDVSSIKILGQVISFPLLTEGWIQKERGVDVLIDTGATMSAIDSEVVKELGLLPFNDAKIKGFDGWHKSKMYVATIVLNGVELKLRPLASGTLPHGVGLVVGMDILSKGEFAYSWNDGHALFSLILPDDLYNPLFQGIKNRSDLDK